MSGPLLPEPARPGLKGFSIDLGDEARRLFRERIRVAGIGLGLGAVFFGVGAFYVGLLVTSGFSPDYLIALLLVVLGLALIGVSLYSGLLNPVTKLRGNAAGLTFERRWGRPILCRWKDPAFGLDIDDRRSDPVGSEESHQRLFFQGPGPIYGDLTPTTIATLLDGVRAYGAAVTMKQLELRERGEIHLVYRIRIRPAP